MVFGLARQAPPPPHFFPLFTPVWHQENLFLHRYQVVCRIGWVETAKQPTKIGPDISFDKYNYRDFLMEGIFHCYLLVLK